MHSSFTKTSFSIRALVFLALLALAVLPMQSAHAIMAVDICVDPGGGGCYTTIQAAINAAVPGNVIGVAAGTYVENLSVTKSLTLWGAQADITESSRTAGGVAESTIQGLVTVSASNVNINGFTLTNPGQTYAVYVTSNTPSHSTITISYNLVDNVGSAALTSNVHAILLNRGPDSVSILHNRFSNIASDRSANGVGVLDSVSTDSSTGLLIQDNLFTSISSATRGAYGIIINNAAGAPGAQILDNTFTTLGGGWTHAIGLEGPTPNAVVTGNIFSNLTASGADNAAVFFEKNPGGNTVDVSNNQFNGSGYYGVAIHPNDMPGGLNGYNYTVNVSYNWWGSNYGPNDPTGTIEVPVVPEPSVADMLNAAPAGLLGVGVSEYVDYYPFTSNAPLTFSPDPVTFVNQMLNTTSSSQTVTITNIGALDVTLGTLGISGDFALVNDLCSNTTLAPTIPSDAPSTPDTVSLAGTGFVNSIMRFRSIGVNDGTVRESSETSSIANFTNSTNALINVGDDALKRQFKGILDFNTATLPDGAVITGATLQVRAKVISTTIYTKLGNMVADITNPFFGSSVGMNFGDFNSRAKASKVGTFTRASTIYKWITLRVNTASLFAVNKTGHTQFRLRFMIDDSNDTIDHQLFLQSGNNSVISYRPMLVITYYVP